MAITKCTKCNGDLRIGTEKVGTDKDNLPVYHRFGYCDKCMFKYDIDILNIQNQVKNNNNNKKTKKKNGWVIAFIVLFIFYVISISNDKGNTTNNENENSSLQSDTSSDVAEISTHLSDIEVFSNKMNESSDYVSYETSENLYKFLHDELLFENITFKQKNSVGDILFDVNADNYKLMISVDNDGIYSVRCGSYDLYDGEFVLITKQGLDDRSIDNESAYYSIAQEIVSDNLKSPKSADFPSLWSDEVKMQRNKDMVIVQSYVDSQNSFGAVIRSQWQVEFKVIDLDSFSYEIIYINIDGTTAGEFIKLD